ncbi:unnamed protein product [Peronospora farinosa]|uniref:Uncharacterized protein n=1 Tax=Peronospora farinosa TaxID=134698 RepID=A0ABN8BRG7_9STRA|nr:unnamed protein product [Peronospora farinosa]
MKQWKKNFGLAQRAMTLPPDTAGIGTREESAARRKCGKDGQEDDGRGESEGCPTWWPGRSSTRVWWCPAPNEGRKRAAQRDDEEEIREEIDLTQADRRQGTSQRNAGLDTAEIQSGASAGGVVCQY